MTTAGQHWSMGDDRMVRIELPASARVEIARAGDVRATGLRGPTTISSDNGRVDVVDFDGPSLAIEASHRIALDGIRTPRLDVTGGDSRIDVTGLSVRDGRIEGDGRVLVAFAAGADAVVDAATDDGKISLTGFPDAPAADAASDDDDASARTVRVGDGTGRLSVRSSDGGIELRR